MAIKKSQLYGKLILGKNIENWNENSKLVSSILNSQWKACSCKKKKQEKEAQKDLSIQKISLEITYN